MSKENFTYNNDYVIIKVQYLNISYGREVDIHLQNMIGEDIHNISATKIRADMRKEGKLADIDRLC